MGPPFAGAAEEVPPDIAVALVLLLTTPP